MLCKAILAVAWLGLSASSLFAQLQYATSVLVSGSYIKSVVAARTLFAVNRWGLRLFDLAAEDTLQPLGSVPTPDEAFGLTVVGNYAYVADRDAGLIIVDVQNRLAPTVAGRFDTPGGTNSVFVEDSLAYLADGENGLVIVDVTDRANPTQMGQLALPGVNSGSRAMGVVLVDDFAYVAAQAAGVVIVDISQPRQPRQVAVLPTPGWAHDVVLHERFALVADRQNGMLILDVGNPSAPAVAGGFLPNEGIGFGESLTFGVAAIGNLALVTDTKSGFLVGEPAPENLVVADISNAASPLYRGGHVAAGEAVGVSTDGESAYLSLAETGLQRLSLKSPEAPVLTARFESGNSVTDLALQDGFGYVANGESGLAVLDVSDPWSAHEIAQLALGPFDSARSVAVNADRVFLGKPFAKLSVVDITVPASPRLTNEIALPLDTLLTPVIDALTAAADHLYAGYSYPSTGSGGVMLLDISAPDQPVFISNFELDDGVFEIAVEGDIVYAAAGASGAAILNFKSAENPRQVTQLPTTDLVRGLSVWQQHLFLAEGKAGLRIFSISDVANPAFVAAYKAAGETYDVTVTGDEACLANFFGSAALTLLNVDDPARPRLLAQHDTPGFAAGVVRSGDAIFVLDVFDISVFSSTPTAVGDHAQAPVPADATLFQNFPNPFNGVTRLSFYIPRATEVTAQIWNVYGRKVSTLAERRVFPAGMHSFVWRGSAAGRPVAAGVYFVRLRAGSRILYNKMVYLP